jgi:hypothetical protein
MQEEVEVLVQLLQPLQVELVVEVLVTFLELQAL